MTKRRNNVLRPIAIEPFPTGADAAVLISCGNTRVLCSASVADDPPKWIKRDESGQPTHGWVTAEYAMLPGSTDQRKRRGPDSRGTEIQRLIGRSLRAAVDMDRMPGAAITCDCDVLVADGGTRTASISGAYVALATAIAQMRADGRLTRDPLVQPIAAVSVGIVDDKPVLDLDYALDSRAQVDLNVVMAGRDKLVEVQGTGERGTFSRSELDAMLDLAGKGITQIIKAQKAALAKLV